MEKKVKKHKIQKFPNFHYIYAIKKVMRSILG